MRTAVRNVAILGATGSIGRSTLEVIDAAPERFRVVGLTANRRLDDLCALARHHEPAWVVATDGECAAAQDWSRLPAKTERLIGPESIRQLVSRPEVDIVVAAIVGSAGLEGTWAALEAGKAVALANKETLVMAGPLVMQLAQERRAPLLPVDSEHSAIFQALHCGDRSQVRRIVLTASGGPFRTWSREAMERATVQDALAHPTWSMGPKITVDSATMMNKALEVIEARWLFQLEPDQIEVVIHPQSIVHSLVEFVDGSIVAQLSPPDMRLPIQYALSYPERWAGPARRFDFSQACSWSFAAPDLDRFPALALGYEVARSGGTAGAVLNAANEAAVACFLAGEIPLTRIVPACRAVLNHHEFDAQPTLDRLIQLDQWGRQEVQRWVRS